MQFSDTVTKLGIVEHARFLAQTTENQYHINDLTRNINAALDRYTDIVLEANQEWDFGDTNATTFTEATTSLVNGQADYTFPTDILEIDRVEVTNASGQDFLMTPIDQSQIGIAMTEFMDSNSTPRYYDKKNNSLILYPAPNYDEANGLRVYYRSAIEHFTSADTTKIPGIPSIHHEYLAVYAAHLYAFPRSLKHSGELARLVEKWEQNIPKHYRRRGRDRRKRITSYVTSSR